MSRRPARALTPREKILISDLGALTPRPANPFVADVVTLQTAAFAPLTLLF